MLVTASTKGTLLRVFNTETGEQIIELRRGADQAVITDVSIDPANKMVVCTSDKGTIHIFHTKPDG
jgi:WD40 repeat protein